MRCPDCSIRTRYHESDRCPERRTHFVYRVLTPAGELIYIGCTVDPWTRFADHRTKSDWYDPSLRVEWTPYPSLTAAREAERLAIFTERPRHNRHHNPTGRMLGVILDLATERAS